MLAAAATVLLVGAAPGYADGLGGSAPTASATGTPAARPATPSTATDDLYAVYCLAPEHRAAAATAAVRLGLARAAAGHPDMLATGSGRSAAALALPRWAAAHPAGFRRACAAVVAAAAVAPEASPAPDDSSDGGLATTLLTAIGAAIGSVFTLLGALIERRTSRGRQWTDALDKARTAYSLRAREFLGAWTSVPGTPFDDAKTAYTELANLLRTPPGHGARRAEAAGLAERLPLAEPPKSSEEGRTTGIRPLSVQERRDAAARCLTAVDEVMLATGALTYFSPLLRLRRARRSAAALIRRSLRHGGTTR